LTRRFIEEMHFPIRIYCFFSFCVTKEN
jgi:hypothetical protein